jgi:Ca-activated chloride channel family protein
VKPNPNAELLTIKLRYKLPEGDSSILIDRPVKGKPVPFAEASENFRFSAAVAEFGMLLRNSEYKANADISQVIDLAMTSRGNDAEGYRSEFTSLAKMAKQLNL